MHNFVNSNIVNKTVKIVEIMKTLISSIVCVCVFILVWNKGHIIRNGFQKRAVSAHFKPKNRINDEH